MQFLYPTFLYALLALAIPIIIHLFFFRRFKKVYFTNVRFLKEIKEETSARQRLKNLLVLLMRLLAMAALVLAFAQPFIPQDTEVKKGEKAVSLFIDNSFSMSALNEEVPLLEEAKRKAKQIIEAYSVEDRFQVLTNDFEGRHQRMVSKEDAVSLVEEIAVSPAVKSLSKVMQRQKQALQSSNIDNQTAYVISDFQKNITDVVTHQDTTVETVFIPLQSVQEKNISIDSCWFEAPVQMINQTNTLVVKLQNHSDQDAENIRLSLKQDGQVKPVGTFSIPARSAIMDTINITILRTGWHEAELTITDYPVQFDDTYYFAYNVAEEINILVINETAPNKYLNAAFEGINYFKIVNQQSQNLDYAGFPNYQLIVTNGLQQISTGLASELSQYVDNGGNLLVFPGTGANLDTYRSFLTEFQANELQSYEAEERSVATINTDEFVFKDVFENQSRDLKLPVTQGNYKLTNYASRKEEVLLTYRDGTTYLGKYQSGQGHLYLCVAPLDEANNNLVRNGEIFIPMLYKMAISSAKDRQIAYTISKDDLLETENRISAVEMVYKLKGKAEEFIPQQKAVGPRVVLGINNQIKEAGYYELFLKEQETLSKYAFNYDRLESDLEYFNQSDLAELVGPNIQIIQAQARANLTPLIGDRSRGIVLWRWCLVAALVFLALEALLLRIWKTT
ncbi:MAG: BatA domain-containing protein [Bacteroidota bacterium]